MPKRKNKNNIFKENEKSTSGILIDQENQSNNLPENILKNENEINKLRENILKNENESNKFREHIQQIEEKFKYICLNIKEKHKMEIQKINEIHEKENQEIEEKFKICFEELKDKIFDYRDAFSEILMSDKGNVRQVLQNVLEPYTDMSDRDFVKLSQKAVNDLFDWAVQTTFKEGVPVNTKVARILLGTETEKSAAEQIIDYRDSILGNPVKGIAPKPDHKLFNNIILNSLSID